MELPHNKGECRVRKGNPEIGRKYMQTTNRLKFQI